MAAETELERMVGVTTGVYAICNTANGKMYVGSSSKSLSNRFREHKRQLRGGYHHNRHLQSSWDHYGARVFHFQVLEACEPSKCLEREQHWIDTLKAADRQYGYNGRPKAESNLGKVFGPQSEEIRARKSASLKSAYASGRMPRFRHNAEARAKISTSQRGRKRSEAFKAKLRAIRTGWKFSEETRAKLSAAAKKRGISPELRAKMQAARRARHGF